MKLCLSFVISALASATAVAALSRSQQAIFELSQLQATLETYPGFDLDLDSKRLVQFSNSEEPVWISEMDKIQYKAMGLKFFDITDSQELGSLRHLKTQIKPSYHEPNATEKVVPVLKELNKENMEENLRKFSSYRTRYYRSDTGRQSQQWLISRISEITKKYASDRLQSQITIKEFPHSWAQNSIVLSINGSESSDEVVVIGAHQDSTNMWPFLPAPGADDDGSGTVTILEAYRALISSDFQPLKTVEFHWYSAEEGGLLGSQAVAKDYEARGVNVIAMSQFDMTAWVKKGTKEVVGIINDFVDPSLTEFNIKLVEKYLDIPPAQTKCGYACSDHASWSKAGYPSIFTIESTFEDSNQNIHSTNDRIDISTEFSFDHMLEFAKLAVAFGVELGGWTEK
ncbi:peptidase [Flagelloscypha sp. PMI_526]|nr:peptidase [Flagelloscypha sp. PMI_526]